MFPPRHSFLSSAIGEPSGKATWYPFPGYEVENPGLSTETRRTTYNLGGTAVATRENGWLFGDDFNDGNANGWTAHNGTWSVSSSKYRLSLYSL